MTFTATSHQGAGPTHPHAEGRQAPPCPVTQVEEKETGDWDEVHICKKYSVILISSVSEEDGSSGQREMIRQEVTHPRSLRL